MRTSILFVILCYSSWLQAQTQIPVSSSVIDSLLSAEQFEQAAALIDKNVAYYFKKPVLDSLSKYPLRIGKTAIALQGNEIAEKKVLSFISRLEQRTKNPRILFQTYLSLDELYLDLANDAKAAAAATKALHFAQQTSDVTNEELGHIYYILGGDYYALYDDVKALENYKKSITYYEKSPTVAKHTLADSYNATAIEFWELNQLEKAESYYRKAIKLGEQSDLKGYDKDYYIALFEFNLALVIDDQGKVNEAIALEKKILRTFQIIIECADDAELIHKAKQREAGVIANLAAFYNNIGYVDRAYEMIKYSYEKKQALYDNSDPNLASVLTRIAGAEVSLRLFDKALETTNLAFTNLHKAPENYPSIEAELYYMMAKSYEGKQNVTMAKQYFDKSEALFQTAYPQDYSRAYLTMLKNYSQFLAQNGFNEFAFAKAEKVYTYVKNNTDSDNITSLNALSNLASVRFKTKNYEQSLLLATEGNAILDRQLKTASNKMDSIQIGYRRPAFINLAVASSYALKTQKTPAFLKQQITEINKAIAALEGRRSTSITTADAETLLEDYGALNELSKKLHYDLYTQTSDAKLLDKLLTIQESGVYHRIRTQLNARDEIRFNKVPAKMLSREKSLKEALSLKDMDANFDIATYFKREQEWNRFLTDLKKQYPDYYTLKYATLQVPIADLQNNIPEDTTVLRYFFMEEELFVFIISKFQKKLVKLDVTNLQMHINNFSEQWQDAQATGKSSHRLYQQLWKPIAQEIKTNKVVIIPDGMLYNLSFEMLAQTAVTDFKELSKKSLLAKHTISYNFSSLMLDKRRDPHFFDSNYVGFAPEFTTVMKDGYAVQVTDSLAVDKTYLSLVKQPFITKITKEYSRTFNGKSFLNENASKSVFLENAREHKIIHIGTHAESNNIYPELSRLIFAKELDGNATNLDIEDNSLYTYEIYNTNLAANLAILTACETGKPEFQAGEGMISLAHAFTYAGSESILTSLWQIDEQSSAQLVSLFYENLKEGMPKDKALQQAKLTYLATARGRTASPQYWAGMVLMGDTSPIDFTTGNLSWIYWVICIVLAGILIWFIASRRSRRL